MVAGSPSRPWLLQCAVEPVGPNFMASALKMMIIQQGLLCGVLGKGGLGPYHMWQPSEYYVTVTVTQGSACGLLGL